MSVFGMGYKMARKDMGLWFGLKQDRKQSSKSPFERSLDGLFVWVEHLIAAERCMEKDDFGYARRLAYRCLDEVPDADNKMSQVLRERAMKIIARLPEEMRQPSDV